ncbi:MAG: hypothetical protein ACO35E_05965 [Ilumatobacteraceae bacterium]|jgi:hypothetical protein
MMRRIGWFVTGVAAGVAGVRVAGRRLRRTVRRMAPASVGRRVSTEVRRRVDSVGDAVREGRAAKRNRESELRARLDRRVETLDEHLGPGDTLLVDGEPVDTARVIVLRGEGTRHP